ncbi:MAG: glycoside hydrolase family 20 zincin-like fold domain-containing protein [Verrucomicrobiota bacterium]
MEIILLPKPKSLKKRSGQFRIPPAVSLTMASPGPASALKGVRQRLQASFNAVGVRLTPRPSGNAAELSLRQQPDLKRPGGYELAVHPQGIAVHYFDLPGLHAAVATVRQLLRRHGRRLPCLQVRDWPDFARRGVMLDISRGRVPKLETLLDFVDRLADLKINEFQLYTEHTFAYRRYRSIWQGWGALTGAEIRTLDKRCRELGIDLVPNQNSFGHLRYFLEDRRLKKLAEIDRPYDDPNGDFARRPTTLAPNHPGTLPFLRGLYDELLPNFSSPHFNIGCDETWDLGRGQSKRLCDKKGKGRVYLDFLKQIHREVSRRKRRMQFWGDIILHHPELIKDLPANVIALNWGYEANHPFNQETRQFARAGIPFYVCPGTSTWMTMVGKHDNALANLRAAAKAGIKAGALGYLNTDWGDGGHPQPLAVSWLPFVAGAGLSWNGNAFDEPALLQVLSRDIFHDSTGRLAQAALALGQAHRKLNYTILNSTPLGSVVAAPPLRDRELFCRDGLKCFAKISAGDIRAAWKEIERQRRQICQARPGTASGKLLRDELDLAARMAAESCRFMLWQQAGAKGNRAAAAELARTGRRELLKLRRDFQAYWPSRNKGTTAKCSLFLKWRAEDYRRCRVV